jgi:hypothetical protein
VTAPPTSSPTPTAIADALATTDAALARLDSVLAGLSDGDLHLAHRNGGWTCAQLVSHIDVSVLLWVAALARVQHDPELTFLLREEVGHDAVGYPPPTLQAARRQLASARRTLATCVPAFDAGVLQRSLEIPDLGTMTVAEWTPPILGHAAGHAEQALDVLRDRAAIEGDA